MKWKKVIAPAVITALFVIYYLWFFVMVLAISEIPGWGKFLMGVIPLALAGCMVYVFAERIQEIRSGEEDDLSKY